MKLALLLVVVCACNSAVVNVERTSSGAIDQDAVFVPEPGSDHHFISLPAYPLANCADTLVFDRLRVDAYRVVANVGALGKPPKALLADRGPRAAYELARIVADMRKRLDDATVARIRSAADPTLTGAIRDDDFDRLLSAASIGRFPPDALQTLPLDYTADRQANRAAFEAAAVDFVKLADGFAAAPCAASQQYRYFYGYPSGNISWIDRDKPQQLAVLHRLADDLGVALADDSWPTPAFAFLHFTDVQIREPGAKLGGAGLSRDLRRLEPSFEQDYEQDQYAMFVYDALVETANAEIRLAEPDPDRIAPDVMMHTGDATDMGLQSEFDTFMTYTNKLEVPWYQALGNHDVLAFGNLKLSSAAAQERSPDDVCHGWGTVPCTCTNLNTIVREQVKRTPDNRGKTPDDLPEEYFTAIPMLLKRICIVHAIASDWFVMDPDKQVGGNPVSSFVLSHCGGWHPKPGDGTPGPTHCDSLVDAKRQLRYAERAPQLSPDRCAIADTGVPFTGDYPTSLMHGFDLAPGFKLPLAPDARDLGHYCVQMTNRELGGRRVWAVVLNTNTDAGGYGVFPSSEQAWLRGLLPDEAHCAAAKGSREDELVHGARIGCKDLVLLFAHHPIYALYDQQERIALTDIITRSKNVIGLFVGHHHRSGLRVIRPLRTGGGHAKWEMMGPSVIDYPQAAREVTVKTDGELGYIEILTYTPHGTGASAEKIRAAEQGAIRDKCRNAGSKWCPDHDGRIRLPDRNITFPRLFFRMP